MQHAYLIIAHNNFDVLKQTLRLIDDKRNTIYLMIDAKSRIKDETIESLKSCVVSSLFVILEPKKIYWGGVSIIRACLDLLEAALSDGIKRNTYFHFMQGADLPIKTQDEIHEYFDSNYGTEYINTTFENSLVAKYRKNYYHLFVENRWFRNNILIRIMNHGLARTQRFLHLSRCKDKTPLYYGSGLFSITRELAYYVVERKIAILKEYRYTLACDEVFMQTLVMNSPFRERLKAFNARLIIWTKESGKNHPHVWRMNELYQLLKAPRELCFARKFDENVDMEIVNAIVEELLSKGSRLKENL